VLACKSFVLEGDIEMGFVIPLSAGVRAEEALQPSCAARPRLQRHGDRALINFDEHMGAGIYPDGCRPRSWRSRS